MTTFNSLNEILSVETSRRNTDIIAGMVLNNPEFLTELMNGYLMNQEPLNRRAAWAVDTISEKEPDLLNPYLPVIIQHLPEFISDGMKRQTLRMLSRYDIPLESASILINLCFEWLVKPAESVAVKVFCMDILYRISKVEPGLKPELADSIEWRMDEETPGFRAHGKKILKNLRKELRDLHP
jgi:hypothetical protein